jgi:hypothetical protein
MAQYYRENLLKNAMNSNGLKIHDLTGIMKEISSLTIAHKQCKSMIARLNPFQ